MFGKSTLSVLKVTFNNIPENCGPIRGSLVCLSKILTGILYGSPSGHHLGFFDSSFHNGLPLPVVTFTNFGISVFNSWIFISSGLICKRVTALLISGRRCRRCNIHALLTTIHEDFLGFHQSHV